MLVVSFNITLLNYLRDLAVRHVASRQVIRKRIEFLHFHYWCKRVCALTGHFAEYFALWRGSSTDDGESRSPVLDYDLPRLTQEIYRKSPDAAFVPTYDAILVDEGQDFLPDWWQALRRALAEGGEMILVADKTQNVYRTAHHWTEAAMENAGFRGPWAELKIAYRLHPKLVPHAVRFAEAFLDREEADFPLAKQTEIDMSPVQLRWVQVRQDHDILNICDDEIVRMAKRLRRDTAVADITVLSAPKLGERLVKMQRSKGIRILDTFDGSPRKKRAFFQGDARIKATTLHSFKGWEARHLIVCVESIERAGEKAVLYTALTRLLDDPNGSCLTVVSNCPRLDAYGRTWPDTDELLKETLTSDGLELRPGLPGTSTANWASSLVAESIYAAVADLFVRRLSRCRAAAVSAASRKQRLAALSLG